MKILVKLAVTGNESNAKQFAKEIGADYLSEQLEDVSDKIEESHTYYMVMDESRFEELEDYGFDTLSVFGTSGRGADNGVTILAQLAAI